VFVAELFSGIELVKILPGTLQQQAAFDLRQGE